MLVRALFMIEEEDREKLRAMSLMEEQTMSWLIRRMIRERWLFEGFEGKDPKEEAS